MATGGVTVFTVTVPRYIEDWVIDKAGGPDDRNVGFLPFPTFTKTWNTFVREEDQLTLHARALNFAFIVLALGVSITVRPARATRSGVTDRWTPGEVGKRCTVSLRHFLQHNPVKLLLG